MYSDVPGSQRMESDPLQLKLQVFVSHPMWVLGSKHVSSVEQ